MGGRIEVTHQHHVARKESLQMGGKCRAFLRLIGAIECANGGGWEGGVWGELHFNLDEAAGYYAGEGWWVCKNLRRQKKAYPTSGIGGIKEQVVFVLKRHSLEPRGGALWSKFRQCNEKGQVGCFLAEGVEKG